MSSQQRVEQLQQQLVSFQQILNDALGAMLETTKHYFEALKNEANEKEQNDVDAHYADIHAEAVSLYVSDDEFAHVDDAPHPQERLPEMTPRERRALARNSRRRVIDVCSSSEWTESSDSQWDDPGAHPVVMDFVVQDNEDDLGEYDSAYERELEQDRLRQVDGKVRQIRTPTRLDPSFNKRKEMEAEACAEDLGAEDTKLTPGDAQSICVALQLLDGSPDSVELFLGTEWGRLCLGDTLTVIANNSGYQSQNNPGPQRLRQIVYNTCVDAENTPRIQIHYTGTGTCGLCNAKRQRTNRILWRDGFNTVCIDVGTKCGAMASALIELCQMLRSACDDNDLSHQDMERLWNDILDAKGRVEAAQHAKTVRKSVPSQRRKTVKRRRRRK